MRGSLTKTLRAAALCAGVLGCAMPAAADAAPALRRARNCEAARRFEPTRISAYANLISGAAEQLGRWWLYNRHVSRETISRYQADFLWSGGRELRDDAPAQSGARPS